MIPINAHIAFTGADIISMIEGDLPVKDGLLLVQDQDIVYCGPALPKEHYRSVKTLDCTGMVIMPSFYNQHTHPSLSLFRGLGADLSLYDWLQQVIWPLEKEFSNPDFVKLGTDLSLAEMILSGTGAAACMDFHSDVVAQRFEAAGIRAYVGEPVFDKPTPTCDTAEEAFEYTHSLIHSHRQSELINVYMVLHAPYTSTQQTFEKAAQKSKEWGIMSTSHVAETKFEFDWAMKEHQKSPVEMVADSGLMNANFVLIHGVHLSASDMDLLHKHQIPVIHNPHSNMVLGSGVCDVKQLHEKGIIVGLGTDSAASNNQLSMLKELQTATRLHKAHHENASILPANQVLKMATTTGYSIYQHKRLGELRTGYRADFQAISLNQIHTSPHYGIAESLVYSSHPKDIKHLVVNGKLIMEDRNILTIDTEIVKKETKKMAGFVQKFLKENKLG